MLNDKIKDTLVKNVALSLDKFPVLKERSFFIDCLDQMTKFKIGTACIIDEDFILLGIITDGDIRRNLISNQKMFSATAVDYCSQHFNKNFKATSEDANLLQTINQMSKNKIWDLPVVKNGKLVGLLHLQTILEILIS